MAKKARDFAAEYARRIRNATARGLTRSQARGHPGAAQQSASRLGARASKPAKVDCALEAAIKEMRNGASLTEAARQAHVGRERLATYVKRYAGAERNAGRWTFNDTRVRRIIMAATGEHNFLVLKVPGYKPAELAGLHYTESLQVLSDPDLYPAFVERWSGKSILDNKGAEKLFETNLNAPFRAHLADDVDWTRIYEIIMP